jgi:hypothetical protein
MNELLSRTLFAKPYTETAAQREQYEFKLTKQQAATVVKGFVDAIEDGDKKKVERLYKQYAPLVGGVNIGSSMQTS